VQDEDETLTSIRTDFKLINGMARKIKEKYKAEIIFEDDNKE
jgi:hypothetical protein